jgi:hypothetical protein
LATCSIEHAEPVEERGRTDQLEEVLIALWSHFSEGSKIIGITSASNMPYGRRRILPFLALKEMEVSEATRA